MGTGISVAEVVTHLANGELCIAFAASIEILLETNWTPRQLKVAILSVCLILLAVATTVKMQHGADLGNLLPVLFTFGRTILKLFKSTR